MTPTPDAELTAAMIETIDCMRMAAQALKYTHPAVSEGVSEMAERNLRLVNLASGLLRS